MSKPKTPTTINVRDLVIIQSTPTLALNPTASKEAFKAQAQTHLMAIRAQLEILPEEALSHVKPTTLIYVFDNIERLACELQEFLTESQ